MPKRNTRVVITDMLVRHLKPAASGKRVEVWDAALPGFGVRITDRGAKSFFLRVRISNDHLRFSWPYPATSLGAARKEASLVAEEAERGINPKVRKAEEQEVEQRQREATRRRLEDTVKSLGENFIKLYAKPKNRTWKQTEAHFLRHINPAWGDKAVTDLRKRDVLDLMDRMVADQIPIAANRVLSTVRRFLKWCVQTDILEVSPAASVQAPGTEMARKRVLSDTEIRAFWRGTDELGWPFGPCFRLMLVTVQRRQNVASMRWEDISDAEKVDRPPSSGPIGMLVWN